MSNPWFQEAWRALAIAVMGVLIGWWIDHVVTALLLAFAVYASWHIRQAYRLEKWLRHGKRFHPPESSGIWEEIFQEIYRLQQRNRKRKRKLGSMLNRFQSATAAMPDATVVLDGERLDWWNDAAERLLGLTYPRDSGQSVSNLIRHPDFLAYLRSDNHDTPIQIQAPGNPQCTLSIRLINYGKGQRLLLARDITRLQHLERVRSDFVANVSHELRTPLTVISGYLETLLEDRHEPTVRRTLIAMREQSDRMQGIVKDLLILSRLESRQQPRQQTSVDVPALLLCLLDDARQLSGELRHQIELELDDTLLLLGDETELRSLFSNLVFNAVHYTPAEGHIQLRWHGDELGAHFEVQDSGIGISPQHIPRLTERFYRVDVGRSRGSGGTGLGLAIVKHVLLRHDGNLAIESQLGQGSLFRCDFPASRIARRSRSATG